MENENIQEIAETPAETPIVEIPETGFLAEVKKSINAGVTKDQVFGSFLDGLIEEKKTKRAESLRKSFDLLVKHTADLNKIRPKSPGADESEQPLPKIFSSVDAESRKKLKEKIGLLEAAIKKALQAVAVEADWVALDNAIQKNS